MTLPRASTFRVSDLVVVADAPPPDNPSLRIGDRCRLNSGGPLMTVVDVDGGHVTASWRDGEAVLEWRWHRATVRRAAT
jgi:uncharacterized protein YodC (DUF2158 family)